MSGTSNLDPESAEVARWRARAERAEGMVRRFQAICAAAADHVYLFDPGGRFQYVSTAGAHAAGVAAEDMVGKTWHELGMPADVMAPFDAVRQAVQADGKPRAGEMALRTAEGLRSYEYVLSAAAADGATGTVASIRDITDRKAAEEALRESEDRMRLVVTHAPFPIVLLAEDGEVLQLNEAWKRITGYTAEDVPTLRAWTERAHGPRAREVEETVGTLFDAEGPVDEGEIPITTRDAETRIWHFFSTPLGRTADGRRMLLTAAMDLTERRRAEDALREGERRFRGVFDTTAIGISLADLEGHPGITNPALQEMLGYTADELAGMTIPDFTHPDDVKVGVELFAELISGQRDTYQVEKRYVRKDGRILWGRLTTSLVRAEDGTPWFVVGMVEDISARRAAEAAVRESEARFRATFDQAGVGMVVADEEGRFLSTNPRFQEFLGYSADELAGMAFTEITWPDDIGLDWELFEELRAGRRERYEIEKRYLRRDGSVVWGRLIGSMVRDGEGRNLYGLGMIEDITARREAEEARARLIAILEATPDAVGIIDIDGHTVYLNRSGRRMLGFGEAEDIGDRPLPSFHPDWAASLVLREGLPVAMKTGSWTGESALLSREGREIPVSQVILAHRGQDGAVRHYSTIARDTTDRHRSAEAQAFLLEASRALSASLDIQETLACIGRLMVPARADYCFVDMVDGEDPRRAVAVHRQPDRAEIMARLKRYPARAETRLGVGQVLRTGEPLTVPEVTEPWLRAVSDDPEHLALLRELGPRSELIVPLRALGRVLGVVTIGVDGSGHAFGDDDLPIAEELCSRAALALENARLYQDAQRATAVRDEVLRVVAHDLRNPLYAISLAVGTLSRLVPEDHEELRPRIETIHRSIDAAHRLIRDLLDVGRMEGGGLPIEVTLQRPEAVVKQAVSLHGALADERGIALLTELPDALPPVLADRDRIVQVFSNLIGNALKFTPEGGRVTLRAAVDDGQVRFEVQDTGPGIPDEHLPQLFEPFWQADRARGTGAGLGLAIVRGIVEAHGGEVEAASEVGVGTTFSFTVPVGPMPP